MTDISINSRGSWQAEKDFWTVYFVCAYQGPVKEDNDHLLDPIFGSERSAMMGIRHSTNGRGPMAMVYRETLRDYRKTEPGVTISEDNLVKIASVHELGHYFGLAEESSDIMRVDKIKVADTSEKLWKLMFSGSDLLRIIGQEYPGG